MIMTATTSTKLTRAEAAYLHLASFQRGDTVQITGRSWVTSGTAIVTTAQQHDFSDINRAYLIAEGSEAVTIITVGSLLSGMCTISPLAA